MDTLIRIKAEEVDQSLIDFLRNSFKGKKIAVHVYEEGDADETEYVLSDPIARQRILESIADVKNGVGLKTYTIEELKQIFLNEPEP